MYYPDLNNDPNAPNAPNQPTIPNVNNSNYTNDANAPFTQPTPTYPYGNTPYGNGQKVQPPNQRPPRSRTGRAVITTMLLALLFGAVVFAAGWQFGHGSATTTAPALQQGSSSQQTTIPPLSGNSIEAVREAVIANVTPAVVQINVQTSQGGAIGSGVIIDKRGYIVTNNHVVSGANSVVVVLSNGSKLQGQVVGTDPTDDLAVVKINPPANMAVVPIGDSSKLKVGQEVLAIGNPLGITQTVTNGIVSALNRTVSEGQGGATIPGAIQTDAPINPGNSGGALVNLQGQLIGIPTLTAIDPEFNTPASGVGFAIPSNRVNLIVPQIIQNGHVTHTGRAALGVTVTDVTPMIASQDNLSTNQGALIVSVVNGGGAANAGLQAGDVIVKVGSTDITNTSDLGDALAQANPGQTVPVKVYRGNQQLTLNVTLGELQAGA